MITVLIIGLGVHFILTGLFMEHVVERVYGSYSPRLPKKYHEWGPWLAAASMIFGSLIVFVAIVEAVAS